MTTVRQIMSGGAECIGEDETLDLAAQKMLRLDVGALPICGKDNKLKGIVTDRDIVTRCVATGGDPRQVRARDLATGVPVTVSTEDEADEALTKMAERKIRRLPVLDQQKNLVGMVSQADLAKSLPNERVGVVVEAISVAR